MPTIEGLTFSAIARVVSASSGRAAMSTAGAFTASSLLGGLVTVILSGREDLYCLNISRPEKRRAKTRLK
jgi:hypothetical protein